MHQHTQWHSQVTDDARALHVFVVLFFGRGRGGGEYAPLVNFASYYCSIQVVFETIFELPVGLESGVVLTHDFGIRAHSKDLLQY